MAKFKKGARLYSFSGQLHDEEGKLENGEQVTVLTDTENATEGAEVVITRVGEDGLEADENFTGDVVTEDGTLLVEDGKVVGVEKTENVEMNEDEKPKEEETKTEEVNLEDETQPEAPATPAPTEDINVIVKTAVDEALTEVFAEIAKVRQEVLDAVAEQKGEAGANGYNFKEEGKKESKKQRLLFKNK